MGKPRFTFDPEEVRRTASGEIARGGHKYKFTFPRESAKQVANYSYDFGTHPLRDLLREFFFQEAEGRNSSTLHMKAYAVSLLGEFMELAGEGDLTPESFKDFIEWMVVAENSRGETRFTEASMASYVNNVRQLYESGIRQGRDGWEQSKLDLITELARKKLRGRFLRSIQASIDSALSFDSFSDLAKAVSIEFQECRRVLEERNAGTRESLYNLEFHNLKMIDPNPFVVFALLAAMRLGLRSSEFNAIEEEDIKVDSEHGNHEIYVHAPDKTDDFIPVDETILEAVSLCREWSEEARKLAGEDGEDLLKGVFFVYRATNVCYGTPVFPMTTEHLNESHLLYFYEKYFYYKVKDEHGNDRPLLHADGDVSNPLRINYRKLRNAFAVRFAEREKDRSVMQRAMRHEHITTTELHYLQQTKLDHAKKVQIALRAEAQLLVLSLKNTLAVGISEETVQRAQESGAITPQGICGAAMEGRGCERAADCLECPFLVVIESRKSRFLADRDEYLRKAEELEQKGDYRAAENSLSRAAICQAQILRIDETSERAKK